MRYEITEDALRGGTDKQREAWQAYRRFGGSTGRAARELGISAKSLRDRLDGLAAKSKLIAPLAVDPSPHRVIKGTSSLLDSEGNVKLQWVKTQTQQADMLEQFAEAVEAITRPFKGTAVPVPTPRHRLVSDHRAMLLLGDLHWGLLACADETGSNWDLDIAEKVTTAAARHLIQNTPPCEELDVVAIGDNTHTDGTKPLTPGSGNILDADSRFWKVFWSLLRTLKKMGTLGLQKHKKVNFWIIPGNHDPTIARLCAIALHEFYESEPRVHVDVSPADRKYFRFGKNLVGLAHGDKNKVTALPGLMAAERKEDWGECSNYYWKCGHIHHKVIHDDGIVNIEHLRTLTSGDAWHIGKGYLSLKDCTIVDLHKEYGECSRQTITRVELEESGLAS